MEVVKVLHELYSRPKAMYVHGTSEPLPQKAATPETNHIEGSPGQQLESTQAALNQTPSSTIQQTGGDADVKSEPLPRHDACSQIVSSNDTEALSILVRKTSDYIYL